MKRIESSRTAASSWMALCLAGCSSLAWATSTGVSGASCPADATATTCSVPQYQPKSKVQIYLETLRDNTRKLIGRQEENYQTNSGVAGIRGSSATVWEHPDGTSTWTVQEGEYDVVNRTTGQVVTLSAGMSYTFAEPQSVLPFRYQWQAPAAGSAAGVLIASFENLVADGLSDVRITLQSRSPSVKVLGGDRLVGELGYSGLTGALAIGLEGWNPAMGSDMLTWSESFRDSAGTAYERTGIPFLFDIYVTKDSVAPIPEPSTLWMLAGGLCMVAAFARKRQKAATLA